MRIAIVRDDSGKWFIRHIDYTVAKHTTKAGKKKMEMAYHCDKHLAGPLSWPEVLGWTQDKKNKKYFDK